MKILGDDRRRGNSMSLEEGCLVFRWRHTDTEPVNQWFRTVKEKFIAILLSESE